MKIIVFAFLLLFCQFSNSTEPQQYTLKEYFSTTLEDVKKSQVLLKQLPTTPHSQDQQIILTLLGSSLVDILDDIEQNKISNLIVSDDMTDQEIVFMVAKKIKKFDKYKEFIDKYMIVQYNTVMLLKFLDQPINPPITKDSI